MNYPKLWNRNQQIINSNEEFQEYGRKCIVKLYRR